MAMWRAIFLLVCCCYYCVLAIEYDEYDDEYEVTPTELNNSYPDDNDPIDDPTEWKPFTVAHGGLVQPGGCDNGSDTGNCEWGLIVHVSRQEIRAFLYNWPPGRHDLWPKLRKISLPEGSHDESTPTDPHPLKILDGVDALVQLAVDKKHDRLNATATQMLTPFWAKAAAFIPEHERWNTRVMLVAMGQPLKRVALKPQCAIWAAMHATIKASPIHSGAVHLVALDGYDYQPRRCDGVGFEY